MTKKIKRFIFIGSSNNHLAKTVNKSLAARFYIAELYDIDV